MILEIFPTEIRETYYVPYRYDNTTSEKNFASGKFQNRYHHFRGMLINAGLIKKFRGQRKKQKTFHNPVRLGFAGNFMSGDCIIFSLHFFFLATVIFILSILFNSEFNGRRRKKIQCTKNHFGSD